MTIPTEIAEIWDFIHGEVVWLHGRWSVYRQIYGTNPERIDLINWASPTTFGFIQRVLINDVQLTLVKLADPAQTAGNENATLETLLDILKKSDVAAPISELSSTLMEYRNCCQEIRKRRNKDISHFDRSVQLSNKAGVLPGPSRQEIENALAALRKFMNGIHIYYKDAQMGYEHFALLDDGNTLMHRLKQAERYETLQESGKIPHEDILNGPYAKV